MFLITLEEAGQRGGLGERKGLVADFGRDGLPGVGQRVGFQLHGGHDEGVALERYLVVVLPRVSVGVDS